MHILKYIDVTTDVVIQYDYIKIIQAIICITVCGNGQYGPDCGFSCTDRCANNRCDPQHGRCLDGCKAERIGPYCLQGKYTFHWETSLHWNQM